MQLFERDLSWLSFNHRVLQEAADPNVPLLERLRFLAIYSSNLDEFYRVRVASYHHVIRKGGKKSSWAEELVEKITSTTDEQQQLFGQIFRDELIPALREEGIDLIDNCETLSESQLLVLKQKFDAEIFPQLELQSLTVDKEYIVQDRTVYFVIRGFKEQASYYLCRVPVEECGRFVVVPSDLRTTIIQMDDLIRWFLPQFLSSAHDVYAIKVSRDAELYLEDEFEGDIVSKIQKSLSKRTTGSLSRLLYQENMPPEIKSLLRKALGLKKRNMIPGGRYHNFHEFFAFPDDGSPGISYEPKPALQHVRLLSQSMANAVAKDGDLLLEFPFHDYEQVTSFLKEAVAHPETTRISVTLYRVASDSAICKLLIEAANKGIQVLVFDEVKARFDEESNIYWGSELEKSGAKVIYSFDHLKVHTKLLQIIKGTGPNQRFETYLGTGNFNEKTSRIYGDFALITHDQKLGKDVQTLFDFLDGKNDKPTFDQLLAAPFFLRNRLCELVDQEIEAAKMGQPAKIFLKMNSLQDPGMIEKLYEASNAGVQVRLIIRGICCLMAGVPGQSENIEVQSIVDRYLEHARIFWFGASERESIYMASADWMTRNLDRRVEVAFPLTDESIADRIKSIFELQWLDNVKSRILDAEQQNEYMSSSEKPVRSQYAQYDQLVQRGDQVS